MHAVYQILSGTLVSVGSVVANPLPDGLTSVPLSLEQAVGFSNGTMVWDTAIRSMVPKTLTAVESNTILLTDLQVLVGKMESLKTFLSDVDVQSSLDRPNNQAPSAQELNRTLKALIRQARLSANFDLRLARYVFGQVHPQLLEDVSDSV